MYAEKRRKEKIQMKQQIRAHEQRSTTKDLSRLIVPVLIYIDVKSNEPAEPSTEALPQYLLDRSNEKNAKALSSQIKQKRKGTGYSHQRRCPR
jgi:ribosome biogenesis protein NSA2